MLFAKLDEVSRKKKKMEQKQVFALHFCLFRDIF